VVKRKITIPRRVSKPRTPDRSIDVVVPLFCASILYVLEV